MEDKAKKRCCNKCGKEFGMENGICREDYIHIRKEWGYFSEKDGKTQEFLICEACVAIIEKEFVIPSHFEDTKEML